MHLVTAAKSPKPDGGRGMSSYSGDTGREEAGGTARGERDTPARGQTEAQTEHSRKDGHKTATEEQDNARTRAQMVDCAYALHYFEEQDRAINGRRTTKAC